MYHQLGPKVYIGLYHYCRLDCKDSIDTSADRARKEAEWFCKVIKDVKVYIDKTFAIQCDIIPILDWEGENIGQPNRDLYLTTFVGEIYGKFGVAPVLYVSGGFTGSKECVAVKNKYPDVPLWVAHYNISSPRFSTWREWLGWQFTFKPFDLSLINEDVFASYAIKKWGD